MKQGNLMSRTQIDNLRNQLQQKEKELYSIQKIGQALSSTLHLDQLLNLIMKEITHLMNADRSTLYLIDKHRHEIWSKIALKAEIKEIRQKVGIGISGHVAATGEIINIPDAYQDSRFDPSTDKRTGYHTRSILCIPVWEPTTSDQERSILGVIQVLNKKKGPFTVDDESILQAVASEVAIAISNARLYEELEGKYKEIDLLYEMEQKLSELYKLSDLFQKILKGTNRHLNCQKSALIFPEHNQLKIIVLHKNDKYVLKDLDKAQAKLISVRTGNFKPKDRGQILMEINDNLNIEFDYFKLIPLSSSDEKVNSAVLLLGNLPSSFDISEIDSSQIIEIIGQKIIRAVDLYSLRAQILDQERLSAVGQMMSTIVHDLRSPVNSINGFLELLTEEENTPEEREEYSNIMRMEIQTITNMTTEILDFAKGKTSILPRKVGVGDILKRFQPQVEQLFKNSGINLLLENKSMKIVYADIDKLTRVFYNIAKNAKEAMGKKGDIQFKIYDTDNMVTFELSDNGPGIPQEIRGRLFDSFVTSGKESGTGLGLAIVKKIVDEHNGLIELESDKNKGTTFYVRLPEFAVE
jgi:signal transduction histidine kinase